MLHAHEAGFYASAIRDQHYRGKCFLLNTSPVSSSISMIALLPRASMLVAIRQRDLPTQKRFLLAAMGSSQGQPCCSTTNCAERIASSRVIGCGVVSVCLRSSLKMACHASRPHAHLLGQLLRQGPVFNCFPHRVIKGL